MEIGSQSVGRLYGAALSATRPDALTQQDADQKGAAPFVETATEAVKETVETVMGGEQAAQAMMAGKADAHSVVEALAAAEMALDMAVTVRDKVVQAYQEILRMPV